MTALAAFSHKIRFSRMRLAGVFLTSQGLVHIVNLSVGLMLVHLLPVDQYALYTVAATLVALISLGANPGISLAVITQGATLSGDRQALGGLVDAALRMSYRLYAATVPVLLAVSAAALVTHDWPATAKVAVVVLVAATGLMRVPTMIGIAILNLQHDSRALFHIGIGEALARLALVPFCIVWPRATIGLIAGLAGATLALWITRQRIQTLIDAAATSTAAQTLAIRRFIVPLGPMVVYYALQGQIAVLILSLFGSAASIAELGAITRLNQIIALGMLLNPFLILPIMARQLDRAPFVNRLGLIMVGLTTFSIVVMVSAYLVPGWWLFVLGGAYSGLERELPVALAISMLTLTGATLHTVVISRNRTSGQHWPILPSIVGQVIFVALHGVADVFDALFLGLIPALVFATVQIILLVRIVREWGNG